MYGQRRRCTSDFRIFAALFCGAQRGTKITQFVVDCFRSFDSLTNFFAKQRAITFAQPVDNTFYCRFLQAEGLCKFGIRNIFPLRHKAAIQDVKNTPAAMFFAFITQKPQRALRHCRCPAHIENSLWRPIF